MALISTPPIGPVDRADAKTRSLIEVEQGWRNFFVAAYNILSALTLSGTTAQRPTSLLWTGRPYFDTDLGVPIWWDGSIWVDATGAPA